MKLTNQLLFAIPFFFIALSVSAKPARCPTTNSIKDANFSEVTSQAPKKFVLKSEKNHFATEQVWWLILSNVSAKDPGTALKIGYRILAEATLEGGPYALGSSSMPAPPHLPQGNWFCTYRTPDGKSINAVTYAL